MKRKLLVEILAKFTLSGHLEELFDLNSADLAIINNAKDENNALELLKDIKESKVNKSEKKEYKKSLTMNNDSFNNTIFYTNL